MRIEPDSDKQKHLMNLREERKTVEQNKINNFETKYIMYSGGMPRFDTI